MRIETMNVILPNALPAVNACVKPDVLQAVNDCKGVYTNNAEKEHIESILKGEKATFVVTQEAIPSAESHKANCYFVYFLNSQGSLKETTFSRDITLGKWFHGNATNVSVDDLKLIFEHIQEHAEWKGYRLVA